MIDYVSLILKRRDAVKLLEACIVMKGVAKDNQNEVALRFWVDMQIAFTTAISDLSHEEALEIHRNASA